MRLIDADELVKALSFLYDDNSFVKNEESRKILTTICEQPTAYDIDKVVEELETMSQLITFKDMFKVHENIKMVATDIATEIVKQGGVCGGCTEVGGCPVREDCPNEPNVCEWKCKGGFIKNPHTNRIYSNEESMKNIYCNTCGKKIKVVE